MIDEAEEEARDADRRRPRGGRADRRRAARRAGRADRGDQRPGGGAGAPGRGAAAALARAKAEMGGAEALGGSTTMGRREPEPDAASPSEPRRGRAGPSLTVVGGVHEEPAPETRSRASLEARQPDRATRAHRGRARHRLRPRTSTTRSARRRQSRRGAPAGDPDGGLRLESRRDRVTPAQRLRDRRHAGDPRRDPRPGELAARLRDSGPDGVQVVGMNEDPTRIMNSGDEPRAAAVHRSRNRKATCDWSSR